MAAATKKQSTMSDRTSNQLQLSWGDAAFEVKPNEVLSMLMKGVDTSAALPESFRLCVRRLLFPLPPSFTCFLTVISEIYREPRFLSPIKDQGSCAGCWAFVTTQMIETAAALQTGKLRGTIGALKNNIGF
jgi:hypothetical protein